MQVRLSVAGLASPRFRLHNFSIILYYLLLKYVLCFNQLDGKQKEILSNKDKVEEHKERIDAINEHLKNVVQELQHTQVKKFKHANAVMFLTLFAMDEPCMKPA